MVIQCTTVHAAVHVCVCVVCVHKKYVLHFFATTLMLGFGQRSVPENHVIYVISVLCQSEIA